MTPSANPTYESRKSLLYQIHTGKGYLVFEQGLKDEEYRDIIQRVTGEHMGEKNAVRSCGLVHDQAVLTAIVAALKEHGWPGMPPFKRRAPLPNVRPECKGYFSKIVALRLDMGLSWPYVHRVAQNMYGIERVEWLDATQMHAVMVALDRKQAARAKLPTQTPPKRNRR